MKKLLLSFLPVLLALTAFTASAQDFSATVAWDTPGAIKVLKGSSPAYATEVEIAADATSYTVTEKEEYIFFPTDEYFIDSATMDGTAQNLTKDYTTGTYYYKLPARYQSSKYNGKTVELVTDKYVVTGDFTLDIKNGADKITFQIQDASGNLTQSITPVNGVNTISLRNVDKQLYMKASGYPAPALFTATNDGVDITQATNGSYTTTIAPGSNVVVALNDPSAEVKVCEIKIVFANNNPDCLNNIRDWTAGKFITPEELAEKNYTLSGEVGYDLQFNFSEDCTFNSISADPASAIELKNATNHRYLIKDSGTITIDATTITYTDQTATLYTNNIEGVTFTKEYGEDSEQLTVTEVGAVEANTVTVGKPVNIATTQYTLGGISGKTGRFFFNTKPGYYIADGSVGNRVKETGDPADYYNLNGVTSVTASECPLYLDVEKINYTTKAVLFYQGNADCDTKVTSATRSGDNAPYLGQKDILPQGYSEITFDPSYNATFSARFNVNTTTAENFYVYADGVAVSASSDSESVFPGIVLKENSSLKLFYGLSAPAVHTLNFTVSDGAEASLSYDQYITTTDFSKSIKNAGSVEYTFTPAEGTVIFLNDAPLAAPYKFTALSGTYSISLMKKSDISVLNYTVAPADGATLKQLSKLTLTIPTTPEMATGEQSIAFEDNTTDFIKVTKGDISVSPSAVEMVGMSANDITVEVYFETPITEEGAWTVNIAEGLMYTTFADENYNYSRKPESALSAATTLTINIDPNLQYKWSFTPDNGSQNPLPAADEDFQFIYISLPEADSLSDEAFDTEGAVGPWLTYNGTALKPYTDTEDGDFLVGYDYSKIGQPILRISVNASVFKYPGTLTIKAEEGAFTVNGNEGSPAIDYAADFGEKLEYTWTFDPAADTQTEVKPEALRTFTLVFNPAQTVAINEDEFYAIFDQIQVMPGDIAIDGKGIIFNIPESYTIRPGRNTLTLGEGSFILDGNQLSPALTATWNVEKEPVSFEWQASPNIDYVNTGEGIYVAFIFGENETLGRGENYNDITVEFNGVALGALNWDNPSEMGFEKMLGSIDYPNAFMFNVYGGDLINPETTGTLKVTIPAGAITVSGESNTEAITYTWNIIKAKDFTVTVTPADGATVESIAEITVEFTNAESAEVYNLNKIYLRSSDYSYSESPIAAEVVEGAEHPTFTLKFANSAVADGQYNFSMYIGAFTLDGAQESPAVNATITVDSKLMGIGSILGDAEGKTTVINLQGIVLMQNATAEDLKTLPAGIYIVNGKKVAIK